MAPAQRLMDAAEDSFKWYHDLQLAFKLAKMAKQLDPRLDGIDQFIAAYEIHLVAAQKNPNGEMDLYGVLGIADAMADIETIMESYRKLVLMVHPDKNSSAAAEEAFNLISEAWNVLSQPSVRKAYDLQWGPRPSSNGLIDVSATYGGRACPNCNQWCNYENENGSSGMAGSRGTASASHKIAYSNSSSKQACGVRVIKVISKSRGF